MRLLEGQNAPYEAIVFPDTIHDAQEVAAYAGLPADHVYKTLVASVDNPRAKPMLVMVPANRSLDLKKLAAAIGEKKAYMVTHADAEKLTGLQVGGISALALVNRGFAVYLDAAAEALDFIVVSAGRRGLNLKMSVADLKRITGARLVDVRSDI
jgi:Cys-tRNA(Pro)/Cys-tRNA(Cys) deacylase